jgi:tetratricopeptide (TPR) repeat protein
LSFKERDWVLISNFENRTGNPLLDGTLEYALERELSNSQFVNVVPRERAGDTLRLMRKPPNTKIDATLGREICLRDGGIRALLTGRVERLGTTYLLSAQLVDPVNGAAVASMSEEDRADSQMAAAIRRLSNQVREVLGEKTALIQQSEKQLEKVSTPSLRALQLYTQADELMHHFATQETAAELLERAVAEDPKFASAHLLLAYTYANREMSEKARPEFQRALELADTATDRERLFILGSYYHVVQRDIPRAMKAYEGLLQLYPDHYWATDNLGDLYSNVGRWEDKWRLTVRLADLRPDDFKLNEHVACGQLLEGDAEGARKHIERAESLVGVDSTKTYAPYVRELPAFQSWSEGNVNQAHARLKAYDSERDPPDPSLVWFSYSAFGEFDEAERHIRRVVDPDDRHISAAVLEFLKGKPRAARNNFEKIKNESWGVESSSEIVVAERCGLWTRLEGVVRKNRQEDLSLEIAIGEHALARGQTKEGIALLEKATDALRMMPTGAFYLGSESLAHAYQKQGNFPAALRVLKQASNSKSRAYDCVNNGPMLGAWWMRTELQLAELYRGMGRINDAEDVETELRKMLIYADADHPILRELQKRSELYGTVSPEKGGG